MYVEGRERERDVRRERKRVRGRRETVRGVERVRGSLLNGGRRFE